MLKQIIIYLKHVSLATGLAVIVSCLSLVVAPLSVAAQHIQPAYRYTVIPGVANASSSFTYGMTTHSDVNYAAGSFVGTVNFAGAGGSDTVTSTYQTTFLTKRNNNGTYAWTRSFDTTTNNGNATGLAVATDQAGNVYLAGTFSGGVIFDGTGGSDSRNISGGGTFITEYTPAGNYLGTKTILPPPNGNVSASGMAIDNSGNMYISGSFNDTVNFAATSGGTDNITDAGGNGDAFVTRFNADGSYAWTKTFDTSPGGAAYNVYVSVDGLGDLYLAGNFYASVNFAGASGSDVHSDPNGNAFVTKFTTAGSYAWTRTFTNTSSSYEGVYGVTTDPAGNVYFNGNFSGSVNFAGANGSDAQTDAGGSSDAFLTKYSPSGSYGWTKTFDTSGGGFVTGQAVTTDENGDIYMLSGFSGAVNFAGASGNDPINEATGDGAVTMYEPDGSYAWTRTFDVSNGSAVVTQGVYAALATDAVGNLYIGSIFSGSVGFDGPGGSDIKTTDGYESSFLTSYKTFVPLIPVTAAVTGIVSPAQALPAGRLTTVTTPNTGFTVWRPSFTPTAYFVSVSLLLLSLSLLLKKTAPK